MELKELLHNVVLSLKLLMLCYNNGDISFTEFEENIRLKVEFIKLNIDEIQSDEEKEYMKKILRELEINSHELSVTLVRQ